MKKPSNRSLISPRIDVFTRTWKVKRLPEGADGRIKNITGPIKGPLSALLSTSALPSPYQVLSPESEPEQLPPMKPGHRTLASMSGSSLNHTLSRAADVPTVPSC